MSNRRKLPTPPPMETTSPEEFSKALREGAERFVDSTVEMLLEKELVPDRDTALRETAIQAAVNASIMYASLPPEIQTMVAASMQQVMNA